MGHDGWIEGRKDAPRASLRGPRRTAWRCVALQVLSGSALAWVGVAAIAWAAVALGHRTFEWSFGVATMAVIAIALAGGVATLALRSPPSVGHAADQLMGPERIDDRRDDPDEDHEGGADDGSLTPFGLSLVLAIELGAVLALTHV
jgi:hypothetical protein